MCNFDVKHRALPINACTLTCELLDLVLIPFQTGWIQQSWYMYMYICAGSCWLTGLYECGVEVRCIPKVWRSVYFQQKVVAPMQHCNYYVQTCTNIDFNDAELHPLMYSVHHCGQIAATNTALCIHV